MKLTCTRNHLMDAISTVQRVVATRSTDKLLDGILLVADQELVLTGYDNETGIEYRMEADISRKGDIVVPAKFLSEVVRKLPDNHVYLEVQEDNILIVESGNSKFRLRGYPADKYPEIRFVEEESRIVVKQKTLRDMINQTIFAASTDYHSRSALTGLNLICERDSLTLVAIDGFRLAIRHEKVPGMDIDINIVIPAKAMAEIARIMSDGDEEVVILPSHNYIIFDKGNVKLVTRLIKSEYMNYRSIIPREADSSLIISPEVLLAAIERASIMIETDDRRFPVTLSMPNNDTMIIESRTNIGEAKEDIPIALAGDRVEIDFNPRFFIEVLREIEDERVMLTFSGSLGPCSIKPESGDKFFYMILPLRR
ncbi:MAG: DNA polymerase III subunit beta [Clostridiaceae bacterium]|jgi:DNA polymerase-3 subunit beta|nr:DNA polymerase III subunit beta [Clostridiaceae bacterium]